jgi:chemotaxis-related protein WspD
MSAAVKDCWNVIGVRGDASCPELAARVHCRNCPVYSSAAAQLLDGEPPAGYVQDSTEQARQVKGVAERATLSVLLFRLGAEWLALPTRVLSEIAGPRTIHSLPHRRSKAVLGLANVRGTLVVCVSLRHLLGIDAGAARADQPGRAAGRLVVMERDGVRAVCPVDEIHGIERFFERDLRAAPATVARAESRFTRAVATWQQHTVGLLDEQPLFRAVERSLA